VKSVAVIVGAVLGGILILVFVILKRRRNGNRTGLIHQQHSPVITKDAKQPYQNVNTGRDGYEIPQHLLYSVPIAMEDTAGDEVYYSNISYKAGNTGRDGYKVPRNLELLEETVLYSVPLEDTGEEVYYSSVPDIAKYMNINGGKAPPEHWDNDMYNAETDIYIDVMEGEGEDYITMQGFGADEAL
jgi:hypothetical protein